MRTIARQIEFPSHDRSLLQISDVAKIRNSAEDHDLRLKADASGKYSTATDLYVRGPLIAPDAVRLWRAVQVQAIEVADADGAITGSVRYRLNNGTSDFWWNGSAWSAPSAGQWNTHADLQSHLPAFPVTDRQLRLVFNLQTTDPTTTPIVKSAMLLFDADVLSDLEELIYRSLVQQLKTIRCPIEVAYAWPGGPTSDLDTDLVQTEPVAFDDVTAAFDYTDDPSQWTDLLSSYDPTTHVATLTGTIAAGHSIVLRLAAVPTVAFTTSPDYNEVSQLPAITIEDIGSQMVADPPQQQSAVNTGDLSAVFVKAPRQSDFTAALRLIAARGLDLIRLSDAVKIWIRTARSVRIAALDARVDLVVERDVDAAPRPDEIGIHDARITIRCKNVETWIYPLQTGHGVGQVVVSGSIDATV